MPAFDVTKLVHDAHFAFRIDPTSHQLEGGDLHYRVLVDERGATLRAYVPGDEPVAASKLFHLTTTTIRRESGPELARDRPAPEVRPDGVASLQHSLGVTETYRNDERGTEQQIRLATRPDGNGALVVRVAVSGLAYREETENGLHFIDEKLGIGFRYGTATFVDAAGTRTASPVSFANDVIELTVPSEVVNRAAYPAVIDPVISPEIEIDQPILGNAYGAQSDPALAFDGTNFVVVFQDPRLAFVGASISAARIAIDGKVLDPVGFVVADTASVLSVPRLACTSQQRCLVSYSDGATFASQTMLVDTAVPGPLPATSKTVVMAGKAQTITDLATDGTNFVAVWNQTAGTNVNVRGARIDGTTGALLDAAGFDIAMTAHLESSGGVDCAGTSCVVAWSDYDSMTGTYALRFSRFTTTAAPSMLDPGGVLIDASGAVAPPRVAIAGGVVAFAWPEDTSVLVRRFDRTSTAALDASAVTGLTNMVSQFSRVVLVAGPGAFALAGTCRANDDPYVPLNVGGHILVALVDPANGLVSPSGGVEAPANTSISLISNIAVATDGTQFVLAFPSNDAQSTGEIVGLRFSASGPTFTLPTIYVTQSSNDERSPSVAAGSDVYLAAWVDQRRASVTRTGYEGVRWTDVYAARIRASDGMALDLDAIQISTTDQFHGSPSVAFDGSRFLVAYYQRVPCDACSPNYDVVGRRVDPATGAILDPTPLPIATTAEVESEPSACGASGRFFVAYTIGRYVAGSVVDGASGAVGAAVQVSPAGPSLQSHGSVTCADDASLAVWQDHTPWFGTPSTDVYSRRFDLATGTFEPTPGHVVSVLGPSIERYPVVTRIGQMFMVAWEDNREGTMHIYAARIGATSGTLYDNNGIKVSSNPVGQADVAIASDGQNAVVVFRDDGAAATSDVALVRIGEGGTVLDTTDVPVAATDTIEGEPVVASTPTGHMLVVYTRFVPEAPYASARVRARTVFYPRANSNTCGDDADCASDHCEDGVCCATSCGSSDPTDCRACSIAAGALTNGMCGTVIDTNTVCRPAVGSCDVAETCDGSSTSCPVNVGTTCDASVPDSLPDASIDAGPDASPDASPDAGSGAMVDASVDATDGTLEIDAPVADAGSASDAPVNVDSGEPSGCGCATGTSSKPEVLVWLGTYGFVCRRRNRRRR